MSCVQEGAFFFCFGLGALTVSLGRRFRSGDEGFEPDYLQQIAIMKSNDRTTLYVDFVHLMSFHPELCEAVQDEYYRVEPYLCEGLKLVIAALYPDYLYVDVVEKKENVFWVAFYNVPASQKLRDLTSNKIGKLLTVSGTVTRTSEVRPELLKAKFRCSKCQSITGYIVQQFSYTEPLKCVNEKCTNRSKWELDTNSSIFTDWQKVRMQETSADIPSGSMPRSLDVILRNEAVDKCKAGDSSVFCGVLIVIPDITQFKLPGVKAQTKSSGNATTDGTRGLKQTGVRDLTYRLCFLASTVRLADLRSGSINLKEDQEDNVVEELTDAEKRDIYSMSQRKTVYGELARSVAPTIFGHDEIKRGILLMLFGGVHKQTMEGINLRGDINVCIVGDPSTSKSQFLKYVVKFMPRAIFTSGKASSAAGLTATVAKDSETGEFNIEAGALMLADNGICCIAEGTPVQLGDGTWRPIEQIQVGSTVMSPVWSKSHECVICDNDARCSRVLFMGEKQCVLLTFEDGRSLVCTPDHRLLSCNGVWIEAANLEVGKTQVAASPTTLASVLGSRVAAVSLRVVNVSDAGVRRVFDLSVPGNTAFMANGVAVHNCIDEFDKMDLKDQVAIHEAMEQQTISIAKAGIHATLNARTSVLAAANPVGGRYDKTKTLMGNLNISAPIMSRFDLFFVVIDEMDEAADYNIARHIVSVHRDGDASVTAPFTTEQLYNYIRFAKTIKPHLTEAAQRVLVEEYKKLRQNDVGPSGKTAYRITVRQLESMIRLSEALARVYLENEVLPEYVLEASRLLRKSIIHVESEDVVLNERPAGSARSRKAEEEARAEAAGEAQPAEAAEQPVKKELAKKPAAKTLSYTEYKRITDMIVLYLRGLEERGEQGGKSFEDLVKWYLEQRESASEEELKENDALIRLILKRLVKKDRILREGIDDPDMLTVHVNYIVS